MKQLLLIFTLFCASYMTVNAQTNTWTGAGANTNWNTIANWSLNAVPNASNDVVIPTGFTVNLNVVGTTKSIVVQGNSTFNITNSLNFTNASSFGANTTIVFSNGDINGGSTLTNNGTLNFTSANSKYIFGNTVLNNVGTINFVSTGVLYINDGTLNNQASGTLDFQTGDGSISYTGGTVHKINNYGLIKRSSSSGVVNLFSELHNDGGTINVQMGELTLNFGLVKLTGGVYNVSAGASLNWANTVTCSGTLTGNLNGQINWSGIVSVPVAATFNFTGSTGVNWTNGSLNSGGILTNLSEITMLAATSRYMYENTTLNNQGTINFESTGVFYVNDGTVNNQSSGLIDLKADGNNVSYTGGAQHILNNNGLIRRSVASGTATIGIVLNNNNGTISVQSGTLDFTGLTKTLTGGTYNVSAGSALLWNSQIICAQTLVGALNGQILWNGEVNVPANTTVTFDFTGSTGINWANGNLSGSGTLVNESEITLLTATSKYIFSGTTLTNNAAINMESTGVLYVNDGTINNTATGIIDLKASGNNMSYTGGVTHVLNNSGLIKSTIPSGSSNINIVLNNNDGTISVENGILNLVSLPKYLNDGTYNVVSGASLQLNSQTFVSGTLAGVLDGEILWNNEVNVPTGTTATFDFTGTTGVNWSNGSLSGEGTLTNVSELTLLTANSKYIYNNTTLTNTGVINYESTGVLYVNDGTINNQLAGLFDMNVEGANLSYTGGTNHIFNNYGLLKHSVSEGISTIGIVLNNLDGTISVESGILNFVGVPKNLTDGTYNVATGSELQWNINIVCAGTLSGVLNGPIVWNNVVNVPTTTTATFDFTGTEGVNWLNGSLDGGGTLLNAGEITLRSAASKYIFANTNLNNEGFLNYESAGVLYVNDGIINNQPSGIIDAKFDGTFLSYTGGATHGLNNAGLLKKSAGAGTTAILSVSNNSGVIDVMSGELEFVNGLNFTNTVDGIVKGIATFDVPSDANFINNGTFAPGGAPGTLNVLGNFKSASTSVLDVELFGLTAGTGYDVLAITGNAIFAGNVNVTLNFAPSLNAQFIVATTSGTITECTLAPTTSTEYNGMVYTFSVQCQNNNQVVLKVTNITLGIEEHELSESSIGIFPNPVRDILTIKNQNHLQLENAQIMDITGKIIRTFSLKEMSLTKEISLQDCASGMYFIKINTENNSITKRIIKQ